MHLLPDIVTPYLVALQNHNRNALGFLPRQALHDYAAWGHCLLTLENDDPAGYLLFGTAHAPRPVRDPTNCRIIQLCVPEDARRILHATALVRQLLADATQAGFDKVTLWCASDLQANLFWGFAGFHLDGQRVRKRPRRPDRTHNHWTHFLQNIPATTTHTVHHVPATYT